MMTSLMLAQEGIFRWWQIPLVILMIALILFLRWYRRRQL